MNTISSNTNFYKTGIKEKLIPSFKRQPIKEYIFTTNDGEVIGRLDYGTYTDQLNYISFRYGIRSSLFATCSTLHSSKAAIISLFVNHSTYAFSPKFNTKVQNNELNADDPQLLFIIISFLRYMKIRKKINVYEYDHISLNKLTIIEQ